MSARLPDVETLIQAGINPRTGLPIKFGNMSCQLKDDIRKQLRIIDEQDALNRYVWENLPKEMDSQLLERILYYRGQGAFFYMEANDKYYFLPYALDGTIDVYGRFLGITPLPFHGNSQTNEKGQVKPWIQGLRKLPVYQTGAESDKNTACVLLNDYSKQNSETIIARQLINDPLLDTMAEAIPFCRTNLIASSGIKGVRVDNENMAASVTEQSRAVTKASMSGDIWVPVIGQTEFQELTSSTGLKTEDYLLYLQSLDNYRLSLYGLDSGGLFEKKAHVLQDEENINQGISQLVFDDGLKLREKFCDVVNEVFNLNISCKRNPSLERATETIFGEAGSKVIYNGIDNGGTDNETM